MQLADLTPTHSSTDFEHFVQFYETEEFLYDAVAAFMTDGAFGGDTCLLIATAEHRAGITRRMGELGIATADLERAGRLILLDARTTLGQFMTGETPNESLFRTAIGGVLDGIGSGRVRAFGEMVDLLWRDGNATAAIELEDMWERLSHEREFSLLCAYAIGNFIHEMHASGFERICRQHAKVLPAESFTAAADDATRNQQIALLQQRAQALETEVAHRRELEAALREALIERRKAEQQVREHEQDLRDFVDNAIDGMHWVGPDGLILWSNRAELELMGYTHDEYVGHHIGEFHVDADVIEQILSDLHRGDSVREREARMRCKDGSIRTVLINSNVRWRDGRFVHTRCFTRDITDRKRAEEELRRTRAEAERASRAKSDFLAVMSHELRTPLNAILGYQDLLEQEVGGPVTRQQHGYLGRIRQATQQLLRLIEQILSLSRIEAGKEQLTLETVDISALLHEASALLEPGASQKGLQLHTRTPQKPIICHSDPHRVRQIMLNLVSNAVKFTESGEVVVQARLSGACVLVEVSDTGSGIPEEDQQRIFEPFVQVDSSSTRRHGGTGLGLAVSRNLARLLGGDITVVSSPGSGSRFTLELPTSSDVTPVLEFAPRRVSA